MTPAAIITSRRVLALCVGLLGVLAAFGGTQSAVAAAGCPGALTTPFSGFGDTNQYMLAPGGSFEGSLSGWTLSGGSKITTGNESFQVTAKKDSHALTIPAGGSATTPPICLTVTSPLIRFFASGGNGSSPLNVEVLGSTFLGSYQLKLAQLAASPSWAPTPQVYLFSNLAALASSSGTVNVQLRFSNPGTTSWQIDDVYIDPWKLK
jgi:hypothetical protein